MKTVRITNIVDKPMVNKYGTFYPIKYPGFIDGLENYYISRDGRIFSESTDKLLTIHTAKGYERAELFLQKEGDLEKHGVLIPIHRLVMYTFNGEPPEDMEDPTVDHINNNRHDNRPENLQWLTRSENSGKTRYNCRRLTDSEAVFILAEYIIRKNTIENIANKLGIEFCAVKNVLNNAGIHIRTTSEARTGYTTEDWEKAVERYKSGEPVSIIAAEMEVNTSTVMDWVKKKGEQRKRGEDNKKFKQNVEKEICEKYLSGISSTELAIEYETYDTTILDILSRNNIQTRTASEARTISEYTRKYTKEEQIAICEDYVSGMSAKELGEKYNIQPSTVLRYLKENGYAIRTNSEAQLVKHKSLTDIQIEAICERYAAGENAIALANEFHVSKMVVYRVLKRNNVRVRSASEAATIQWCVRSPNPMYYFPIYPFQPYYNFKGHTPFDTNMKEMYSEFVGDGVTPFDVLRR